MSDLYTIITTNARLNTLVQSLSAQGFKAIDIGQLIYAIFEIYEEGSTQLNTAELSTLIVQCFNALVTKYNLIPPQGLDNFDLLVQAALAVCLHALPAIEREVEAVAASCFACCKPKVQG